MPRIVKVRMREGARVINLRSASLDGVGADVRTSPALEVRGGGITATPAHESPPETRRRYTLAELLEGAQHLPDLYTEVAGALDAPAAGDEIGTGVVR